MKFKSKKLLKIYCQLCLYKLKVQNNKENKKAFKYRNLCNPDLRMINLGPNRQLKYTQRNFWVNIFSILTK